MAVAVATAAEEVEETEWVAWRRAEEFSLCCIFLGGSFGLFLLGMM